MDDGKCVTEVLAGPIINPIDEPRISVLYVEEERLVSKVIKELPARPSSSAWLAKIVLLLWLVSSVFVIFAATRIDSIVNQELYNFGLRFSYEWANQYWALMRTILVCIALPAAASIGLLLLDAWRKVAPRKDKSLQTTNRFVPVTCPSCKKRFSNTMVMYDYSKGKAELIKICPYCNKVLSDEPLKPKTDGRRSKPWTVYISAHTAQTQKEDALEDGRLEFTSSGL